jgi:hypothetical protein
MTYGELFCNKFIEAYQECRAAFDRDRWPEIWKWHWNNFMLWNPESPQIKPLLRIVAEKMNLKYWEHEPFRLDGAFILSDSKPIGNYVLPIIVAIEHENDLRTFIQEITKLAHIRSPLKVGITYTSAVPGPVSQQIIISSQQRIKETVIEISNSLNKWISEDPKAEYVYILGVESQLLELDWYALHFMAGTDPAMAVWNKL